MFKLLIFGDWFLFLYIKVFSVDTTALVGKLFSTFLNRIQILFVNISLRIVDGRSEFPGNRPVGQQSQELLHRQQRVVRSLHHELIDPLGHDQEVREIDQLDVQKVELVVDLLGLERGQGGGGRLQFDLVLQLTAAYDAVSGRSAVGGEGALLLGHSEVGSVGQSTAVEHHPRDSSQEDFPGVSLVQVHGVEAYDRKRALQLHVVHSVASDALSPGTASFPKEQVLSQVDCSVQVSVCHVDYVGHVVRSFLLIFVRGISHFFSVVNIQSKIVEPTFFRQAIFGLFCTYFPPAFRTLEEF